MTTKAMTMIEQRLAKLESQNRWLKRFACVTATLFALATLVAAAYPDRIVASMTMIGTAGTQSYLGPELLSMDDRRQLRRVYLGTDVDGSPNLSLYGKNGKRRASLEVHQQSGKGGLFLYDKNDAVRVWLDETELLFYDESGNITKRF